MEKAIKAGEEKHLKSAVNWPRVNLIVGIHDDETIREYKETPAMTLEERVTVVEACRYVDKVIAGAPTIITENFIKEHDIDLVVHAHGIEDDAKYNYQHAIPKKLGIFKRIERCEGVSSSEIKERIKK
jgi:glycerol-3-phosphate cytidylyltransferase-like family protein